MKSSCDNDKVKLKFQLLRNLKYTFINNYKKGQKNNKTELIMEIILKFSILPTKTS